MDFKPHLPRPWDFSSMGNVVWRYSQTQDANLHTNLDEIDGKVFSNLRMKTLQIFAKL